MTYTHTHSKKLLRVVCSLCLAMSCMTAVAPAFADKDPNPCPPSRTFDKDKPLLIQRSDLTLIQSLDDKPCKKITPKPGFQIFFDYFNNAWPWVLGCAAGIAVGYSLYGGILVMLSGADSGKRSEGKDKIMWAIAGLLMIGLAGLFLETINPLFFSQG